jgi:XTP/dITP diphosphohydrolase
VNLLFATRNPGKLRELRRLVAGLPVRVVSLEDLEQTIPEVVEDGATFAANAAKKASAYARAAGMHALADDSGLCIDGLWGQPGIRSARWSEGESPDPSGAGRDLSGAAGAGRGAGRDQANNTKLLMVMHGVLPEHRGAEYRAVVALAAPDGTILATAEGSCRGTIGEAPRGEGGFGYDPLFLPEGAPGKTMAELSPAEKDALSHRGEALRRLIPDLRRIAANL